MESSSQGHRQVYKSTKTELIKKLNLKSTLPPKTKTPPLKERPETQGNIERVMLSEVTEDTMAPEVYNIEITCSSCENNSSYSTTTLFEKVECPHCRTKFRIPIETEKFLYDKHIYESAFINIFRAYHKETDFYGDAVVYEKISTPSSAFPCLKSLVQEYQNMSFLRYLPPLYCDEDELAFFLIRQSATFRMNLYIQKYGALPKDQVANILYSVAIIADQMAKNYCYGTFLPSDVLMEPDGTVLLADYAIRESFLCNTQFQNYIPTGFMAPETIFNKVHTEASAVYSLGVLAIIFLTGTPPFGEKDPHQIHMERNAYLEKFKEKNLPSFIRFMLEKSPEDRPSFAKCAEYFIRLHRQLNR